MVGGLQPPSLEDEEQEARSSKQGVIFCLEDAQLEVAQVGKVRQRARWQAPAGGPAQAATPLSTASVYDIYPGKASWSSAYSVASARSVLRQSDDWSGD